MEYPFYKFKTAFFSAEGIDEMMKLEELGIESEHTLELNYKLIAVKLNSIISYYPLKVTNLGAAKDELEFIDDEETLWNEAEYIVVILQDGTQLTIQHDIVEFENLLNNN